MSEDLPNLSDSSIPQIAVRKVDPAHAPPAALRGGEELAACRGFGVERTTVPHYPDGELVADLGLRRALTRVIREVQPEVVLCGDPTAHFYGNRYVNHPDHRAAPQPRC